MKLCRLQEGSAGFSHHCCLISVVPWAHMFQTEKLTSVISLPRGQQLWICICLWKVYLKQYCHNILLCELTQWDTTEVNVAGFLTVCVVVGSPSRRGDVLLSPRSYLPDMWCIKISTVVFSFITTQCKRAPVTNMLPSPSSGNNPLLLISFVVKLFQKCFDI